MQAPDRCVQGAIPRADRACTASPRRPPLCRNRTYAEERIGGSGAVVEALVDATLRRVRDVRTVTSLECRTSTARREGGIARAPGGAVQSETLRRPRRPVDDVLSPRPPRTRPHGVVSSRRPSPGDPRRIRPAAPARRLLLEHLYRAWLRETASDRVRTQRPKRLLVRDFRVVGARGFEPPTSCTPSKARSLVY